MVDLFEIYSSEYLCMLNRGERFPKKPSDFAEERQICYMCGHREVFITLMLRHIAICHPDLMAEIRSSAPPEVLLYDVHWNYMPTVAALSRSVPPEEVMGDESSGCIVLSDESSSCIAISDESSSCMAISDESSSCYPISDESSGCFAISDESSGCFAIGDESSGCFAIGDEAAVAIEAKPGLKSGVYRLKNKPTSRKGKKVGNGKGQVPYLFK